MQVVITDPKIKQAIGLVSSRAPDEKRILSPEPGVELYWNHLVRVYAHLVANGETDQNILLAAVLHDSVEDNYVTLEEIQELFGQEVADIVSLISEEIHTDHLFSGNRDYYFERIKNYPDDNVRRAVMRIKTADRYDNLIGIFYTNLDKKKQQFKDEIDKYLRKFSQEGGLEYLLDRGLQILNGELAPPDIHLELDFNISDELKPR